MPKNPILEELYEIRSEILADYDGEVEAYLRSASERTKASGHPVAEMKQRSIRRLDAGDADDVPVAHLPSVPPSQISEARKTDAG